MLQAIDRAQLARAVLLGLFACVLGFALPRELQIALYHRAALPFALAIAMALILAGSIALWRMRSVLVLNLRGFDLMVALAATIVVTLLVPGRSFVEIDEGALLSTSMAVAFDFSPYSVQSGVYDVNGVLHALQIHLDKRGVLYPLAIAAVHVVFGYSPEHAYVVNALFLFGALFLVMRLVRRYCSGLAPPLAVMLFLSFPVVAVTYRSALMDGANLIVLLALAHTLLGWRKEASPSRVIATCLLIVALSQLRQESILTASFLTLWIGALALVRPTLPLRGLIAALPLGLLVSVWRYSIPFSYDVPPGHEPWSFGNLAHNLSATVSAAFDPAVVDLMLPMGPLLMFGAIAWIRRARSAPSTDLLGGLSLPAVLVAIAIPQLIILSNWYGDPYQPVGTRYYLPSIAVAAMLSSSIARQSVGRWTIGLMAAVALLQLVNAREALPFQQISSGHERTQIEAMLPPASACPIVVLSRSRSIALIPRGVGAMPIEHFAHLGSKKVESLAKSRVLVFAFIRPGIEEPDLSLVMPGAKLFREATTDQGVYQLWSATDGSCGEAKPLRPTDLRVDQSLGAFEVWEIYLRLERQGHSF